MPKLSYEALLGVVIALIVVVLDQAGVKNPFVLWIAFTIALGLCMDAAIRSEWGKRKKIWSSVGILLSFSLFAAYLVWQSHLNSESAWHEQAPPIRQERKGSDPSAQRASDAKPLAEAGTNKLSILTAPAKTPKSENHTTPPLVLPPGATITATTNAPGSAAVGINTGTINVGAPEPKISFVVEDEMPLPGVTRPHECIQISIDRAMDSPQFAVICERACQAVGGGAILPHGGQEGGDQWGSIPNHPRIAAFVVGQPNPMPSNVKFRACVESEDNTPVNVSDVQKLTITGAK
jgi:hypothetical protein